MLARSPRHISIILITAALILAGCNVGATPAPTVDVNAINTAIVGTTVAQLSGQMTQTAQALPTSASLPTEQPVNLPTFALPTLEASPTAAAGALPTISFNTTPVAGLTSLPTAAVSTSSNSWTKVGCNDAMFLSETLPDGSKVNAGKKFKKAWEIQNTGTCTWDEGYVFAFVAAQSSAGIEGYDIVINKTEEFTKPGHSQSFIIELTAPTKSGEYKGYWKLKSDDGTFFGPLVYFDIVVK
ncbi:MAG: NBR1-Ig-like domain-containing protein [Anaerolineales bacterium]